MEKQGKEPKTVDIKRYDKSNLPWSAKQLAKSMDKGTARFDNAVQRTLVWTKNQKSMLIHSMIIGAPIPPMYATKHNKEYDFLDGKQRSACIHDFLDNQFPLVNIPKVIDLDGKEYDFNGMTYDELPGDVKDDIASYSLLIYVFDDLSQREIADIFFRLNSGTPLTGLTKRLALMPAETLEHVVAIAKHSIFEEALTKKAIAGKIDLDLVIKSLVLLKQPEPSLDKKELDIFAITVSLTKEDEKTLNRVFDIILKCSDQIKNAEVQKYGKIKNSIIARRILGRGHLVTLVPFINNHKDEDILFLRDFLWGFYAGETKASVVNEYNEASTQGSGHPQNIQRRQSALEKGWLKFLREVNKN